MFFHFRPFVSCSFVIKDYIFTRPPCHCCRDYFIGKHSERNQIEQNSDKNPLIHDFHRVKFVFFRYAPLPRRFYLYIQEKDGASYRYILLLRCLEKPLKTNERNLPHPVYDMLRHSWGCAINIIHYGWHIFLYPSLSIFKVFQTFE